MVFQMKKYRLIMLLFWSIIVTVSLFGCGDIQSEYYEVHVIVVDDSPFYYIDPSDGKDTIKAQQLHEYGTLFIYLYEAIDNEEFSYEHFFMTIENHFVEENVNNGKLYLKSSEEIDNQINQYFLDKETWNSAKE